ncbi:hypothetical protein SAMN05421876_10436 [Kaistella jeonii]|nr:hypothetical protein SAMN05421876_10436 [Kaistella jeonii]VEI97073.1 Uncharacterised protein [Kaistella jeonii]
MIILNLFKKNVAENIINMKRDFEYYHLFREKKTIL